MKLLLIIISSVCVAFVAADGNCSSLEHSTVKRQWREAFGEGHQRIEFGLQVFTKLFNDHPETRQYFTRVKGQNVYSSLFVAHSHRLLTGLDIAINFLDDEAALKTQMADLKSKRKTGKIKPEYYSYLVAEVLEVLRTNLGTTLDTAAWESCSSNLMSAITDKADEEDDK